MPKKDKSKSKDKRKGSKSKEKKPKKEKKDKKDKKTKSKKSSSSTASKAPNPNSIPPNSPTDHLPVFCVMHKSPLNFYCDSCNEPVCQLCITLGPHNNQVSPN
jgi:palmitoyltransferase